MTATARADSDATGAAISEPDSTYMHVYAYVKINIRSAVCARMFSIILANTCNIRTTYGTDRIVYAHDVSHAYTYVYASMLNVYVRI